MYFPYLYGLRHELRALRDISADLPITNTIAPIIEPVRENPADLRRSLAALGQRRCRAIVIVNPQHGDFEHRVPAAFTAALAEDFAAHRSLLPGLICNARSDARILDAFQRRYDGSNVALLYHGPQLAIGQIQAAAANDQVAFHIVVRDQIPEAFREALPRLRTVDVRDHFNMLERNADYEGNEYFSDGHLRFRGNAAGFGDYSVIGAVYHEGGGPAHAVAIHAVFKHPESNQLWVEHFVSDDVDRDTGSTAEKFHQAARKLVRSASRRRGEFGQNAALNAYREDVEEHHFPGLGVNKQREVQHHMTINHQILSNEI
jgi:hypothetical protein